MGFVGALHSLRSFRRRLPWALGHFLGDQREATAHRRFSLFMPSSCIRIGWSNQGRIRSLRSSNVCRSACSRNHRQEEQLIGIHFLRESTDACHGLSLCRSCISTRLQVWRFTVFKFRHVAHRKISIWLSALRQPAHQSAAPKCHSQKLYGWPSCGGQCGLGCAGKPTHNSSQPWHSPPLPSTRIRLACRSLCLSRHHHGVPPSP